MVFTNYFIGFVVLMAHLWCVYQNNFANKEERPVRVQLERTNEDVCLARTFPLFDKDDYTFSRSESFPDDIWLDDCLMPNEGRTLEIILLSSVIILFVGGGIKEFISILFDRNCFEDYFKLF